MPRKVLIDWPWLSDTLPIEEDGDLDIVEKVERFDAPRCKQARGLLDECRDEIMHLRVELAKEMREQTWMRAEIDRLHVLLNDCRRKDIYRALYEGEG